MILDKHVLAVVPARSGSKGIPDKNMLPLLGVSLIGWAGKTLAECDWLDARVLSTDSAAYAEEGRRYGLETPFMRPPDLSGDTAAAVDTISHALTECESHFGETFDIILVVEPTSPLRRAEDLERAARLLVESKADSVVAVSKSSEKFHPKKIFWLEGSVIRYYLPEGAQVSARQELDSEYYFRNGVCYALTRHCLMDQCAIITRNSIADIIHRPVVNIDEPIELEWAEFLMRRHGSGHSAP